MWIFSVEGFISVVQDRTDPTGETMLVRARMREDIAQFAERVGAHVRETPNADYPFRCSCSREDFRTWLDNQARWLDYPNFKSAVSVSKKKCRPKLRHARDSAYHDVWAVMQKLGRAFL
jgi:hypothetical protein